MSYWSHSDIPMTPSTARRTMHTLLWRNLAFWSTPQLRTRVWKCLPFRATPEVALEQNNGDGNKTAGLETWRRRNRYNESGGKGGLKWMMKDSARDRHFPWRYFSSNTKKPKGTHRFTIRTAVYLVRFTGASRPERYKLSSLGTRSPRNSRVVEAI